MDYYELLGVPREATEQEIKDAYRSKAMKAHPDRGGTAEQMAALNEAYSVLMDAEKRAQYNAEGKLRDPDEVEAVKILFQVFNQALSSPISGMDPAGSVLNTAKSTLQNNLNATYSTKTKAENDLNFMKKNLAGKFKCPENKQNIVELLVVDTMKKMEATIVEGERVIRILHVALSLINDYDVERVAELVFQVPPMTTSWTTTSSTTISG